MDLSQLPGFAASPQSTASAVANSMTSKASAPKAHAAAATGNTGGTSSTTNTSDPSTITSSDFLTLLVSELQNQDPTQPTDPNAYITQLVGVNSLQQLISINSGITSLDSAVTPSTTSSVAGGAGNAAVAANNNAAVLDTAAGAFTAPSSSTDSILQPSNS